MGKTTLRVGITAIAYSQNSCVSVIAIAFCEQGKRCLTTSFEPSATLRKRIYAHIKM
ncbi:hypothetical protein NDA03_20305 [Trichocoleus sp. Lan]|uniref:hypothetical protein n=1 Tax=Trichocoleus sp. Lan TaxID=2933927 RepID=UPI003297D3A7